MQRVAEAAFLLLHAALLCPNTGSGLSPQQQAGPCRGHVCLVQLRLPIHRLRLASVGGWLPHHEPHSRSSDPTAVEAMGRAQRQAGLGFRA